MHWVRGQTMHWVRDRTKLPARGQYLLLKHHRNRLRCLLQLRRLRLRLIHCLHRYHLRRLLLRGAS